MLLHLYYPNTYRAHVEFQLNELPYYPFWFTPAQLAGRLIVNTSSGEIYYFELTLPADKHLNVGVLPIIICTPLPNT